jgi:serine/threonine protein kinase/formylglycine-generating enzyme required for sulfatase activity
LDVLGHWNVLKAEGQSITPEDLCRECPELLPDVKRRIEQLQQLDAFVPSTVPASNALPRREREETAPVRLARYRITGTLGRGGFGFVYQAYDDDLRRNVAIKVPHRHRISKPEDIDAYLGEARVLASLDHPNIVPIHDFGRTDDGSCFIVSKFIEGSDLAKTIATARPTFARSAELVASVAEALHYAHLHRLVHRDIKPGNILLDTTGKAFVTDFGLALKEDDFGKESTLAGTPAYMSPEQARSEGHRVDGRSDIFSLGVVFYEMLTGRRPFRGESWEQLLEQIITLEVRPPRQVDDSVPKELERICLKALAKRVTDRQATAKDLADELRHFLETVTKKDPSEPRASFREAASPPPGPAAPQTPTPALKIVPKGLRSFDANDADFFLELLPGPRDREGLPDSIGFWKRRIEETDPDKTFTVGLIYGPSGCGKSSLVKAGLLPRLAAHVHTVFVETTAQETEIRILSVLGKHFPDLPVHLGLRETLAAVRRGGGGARGTKVLIVLDQFEQWLDAQRGELHTQLVPALRQCDGERLQCVVMVRADFWWATTQFMDSLEIRLVQGSNTAAVDLFDLRHAKNVLAAFGRAFKALPERKKELAKEHEAFLEQAVAGLAEEGKVVPVRLALFSEMIKDREWTPATLRHVGGMAGVGVTFLEENFAGSTAPPQYRRHQKAARAALKILLPDSGTEIRGPMRSRQEILQASGYDERPKDFDELLRLLDADLRLITPTDPKGLGPEDQPAHAGDDGEHYYQLTHDYLVPSLRSWLTRKQKETRRGRAELRLAERTASWNAKPENRHLPALWEWASVLLLTRKREWTAAQRKVMSKATRYHGLRAVALAVLLGAAALVGLNIRRQVIEDNNATRAAGFVQTLLHADITKVPDIIHDIEGYRRWTDPLLRRAHEQATQDSSEELHTSLALLPGDPSFVDILYRRLLEAKPEALPCIRDALVDHKNKLIERLWGIIERPEEGRKGQQLRAACALATYDPESPRWDKASTPVVDLLLAENAFFLDLWRKGFHPVKAKLVPPLGVVFRDQRAERSHERSLATAFLADYAADQPDELAKLLLDADEKQFGELYPKIAVYRERALACFQNELSRERPPEAKEEDKERMAKRQSNAAVALLRLGQQDKVWPLLKHSPDPRVRSYLIHRFGTSGAQPMAVIRRLEEEADISIRRALLLILGEFSDKDLPVSERARLLPKLFALYQDDHDPGMHAAAAWLLRQWGQMKVRQKIEEGWASDKPQREQRLQHILQDLANNPGKAKPHWFVNGQGQTFVVLSGPVEFQMGSPATEEDRHPEEIRHQQRIGRNFALASTHVTREQFKRFHPIFTHSEMDRAPDWDCPIFGVTWYEAVAYCNWLSKQDGLPENEWCYEPVRDPKALPALAGSSLGLLPGSMGSLAATCGLFPGRTDPRYRAGMRPARNYLQRTGYRLPTEAEWEYACRANAATSRSYGESEELLGKYAWYGANAQDRIWPVASLKPNDLGLFDMHGQFWVWCQDRYRSYQGRPLEDIEDGVLIKDSDKRLVRGGSWGDPAGVVRSACRSGNLPNNPLMIIGFRLAKTVR